MGFIRKVYINKFPFSNMFYSEKKTEDFLEKNRFVVVKRAQISNKTALEKILKKFNFPVVMKISGGEIVHKNKLGGIILNINSLNDALKGFEKLKKIKGFEGVIIQEQLRGKEILVGVKKTKDFGQAVCVGSGGTDTEKMKDVSFRIFPFDKKEVRNMISETKISRILSKEEKKAVEMNLMNICELIKKYPKISELDINPLIVNGLQAVVVDARMVLK